MGQKLNKEEQDMITPEQFIQMVYVTNEEIERDNFNKEVESAERKGVEEYIRVSRCGMSPKKWSFTIHGSHKEKFVYELVDKYKKSGYSKVDAIYTQSGHEYVWKFILTL